LTHAGIFMRPFWQKRASGSRQFLQKRVSPNHRKYPFAQKLSQARSTFLSEGFTSILEGFE
jgi:hypothetical protein